MDKEQIRQKDFSRRFRGLDPREVHSFLDMVAEHVGGLEDQVAELARKHLESQEKLAAYIAREDTLQAALEQTRQMAVDIKSNAEREAQLLVAEAELQAEKTLGQAHNRLAQIHDDIAELKRQRAQFEVRLRSLVEAHLKLMDVELDRDRELTELEDKIKILRTPNS
ncbi:MAG: DivIVA domain-containing protein [Deltaproteobacteria bacterium]|nr:DivIVA domain-containing protein [Deltaproteobacteria bacterium]